MSTTPSGRDVTAVEGATAPRITPRTHEPEQPTRMTMQVPLPRGLRISLGRTAAEKV